MTRTAERDGLVVTLKAVRERAERSRSTLAVSLDAFEVGSQIY